MTNNLDFQVEQVGPNGKVVGVETKTTILEEMKGGGIMEVA
jgi:hypothetical protein